MPVVISEDGFRLFFFANEGFEPVHVHVKYGSAVAKFWIKPVRLAKNEGMKALELRKASVLVEKHEKLIQEKWNEFFSKKTK